MKKILLLIAGITLAITLAACNQNNNSEENTSESGSNTEVATENSTDESVSSDSSEETTSTSETSKIDELMSETVDMGEAVEKEEAESVLATAFDNFSKKANMIFDASIYTSSAKNDGTSYQSFIISAGIDGNYKSITYKDKETSEIFFVIEGTGYMTGKDGSLLKTELSDSEKIYTDIILMRPGMNDFTTEAFKNISAGKRSDGTIIIKAEDISDSVKNLIASMSKTDISSAKPENCEYYVEISDSLYPKSIIAKIKLPGDTSGQGEQVYVKYDILINRARIATPENSKDYQSSSFVEMFPQYKALSLGLFTETDNYIMDYKNSENLSDQIAYLSSNADKYTGKTFFIRGTFASAKGAVVCGQNEAGTDIPVEFDESLTAPPDGSKILAKANIVPVFENGKCVSYKMKVTEYSASPEETSYTQKSDMIYVSSDTAYLHLFDSEGSACFILPKDTYLNRIGYTDEWYIVEYMESEYYIKASDAEVTEAIKILYILASSLNVRSSPDFSSATNKVGMLYKGDSVAVLESTEKYNKILFNGEICYISANPAYVSPIKP